ncbi:MAG: MmcB family DNA repair protein [Rhodospirillales bacterium]|nr:MmcB family DNA repair protein [Rhodospirillales bacterium]
MGSGGARAAQDTDGANAPEHAELAAPPCIPLQGAGRILRGVVRLLVNLDYRTLTEFPLPDGRRADVVAIDRRGSFTIVEVKSSIADYRADNKWPYYRSWCDSFFFGISPEFPLAALPDDVGLIVADAFEGVVVRSAPVCTLNSVRRRSLLLRFARTASARLSLLGDPTWDEERAE